MAFSVNMQVWKWLTINWTTYTIYGKMFDPPMSIPDPSTRNSFNIANAFSSVNLLWFQQWLEVCACAIKISNTWSSTADAYFKIDLLQYLWWWQWRDPWQPIYYYDSIPSWWEYRYYEWVWVDPDEIRPDYSTYKFVVTFTDTWVVNEKQFSVSNLSFDTTECWAWYMWVEWNNLCYVPPCWYTWYSDKWYKHIISRDEWYAWWSGNPWFIWIPSSSSDHHIYYTNSNWTVYRTKNSYARSTSNENVWSSNKWFVRMTPSSPGSLERKWYNYLCYVDGWWYKRRMGVWEV